MISAPSVVFNYHEPLSANSETKFEDELLIRNLSKIEPIRSDDTDENSRSFRDHLDTCNDSLAKLVNIFNSKSKPNANDLTVSSYTTDERSYEMMPSDRSLVSANVDRFTDCEKDSVSFFFSSWLTDLRIFAIFQFVVTSHRKNFKGPHWKMLSESDVNFKYCVELNWKQ